jgi:hypothetical protein
MTTHGYLKMLIEGLEEDGNEDVYGAGIHVVVIHL